MVGLGYVTTHVGRALVPANNLGVPYEDVKFETGDGLELEGWYIPSRNGAAVIAFPGRNGPQRHARMLARHGYGVLLFDRRGEGDSEGDPNSWGWGGDADVKAAIDYLQRRPDVDPDRIGGIGLSVGGEMLLETAAETDELKAVVSEGAGARMYAEDMDQEGTSVDAVLGPPVALVKSAAIGVFSNEPPPSHLKDLVGRIAPRPLMLIAAPNSPHGELLNRDYHEAAREPKTLWEIPEASHTDGIEARPAEYERRVVGFFDHALGQ
jgi:dienelactone hydrolase